MATLAADRGWKIRWSDTDTGTTACTLPYVEWRAGSAATATGSNYWEFKANQRFERSIMAAYTADGSSTGGLSWLSHNSWTWNDSTTGGVDVSTLADNWTTYSTWKIDFVSKFKPKSISERMRDIMQSRHAPAISVRKVLEKPRDMREECARQTLRRVVGDIEYRRFLSRGFVAVRAKSGLVYQIFPGHGITNVYQHGVKVERLCVVLTGDFPPTDSVIMRYLLILNDEGGFRDKAIKHQIAPQTLAAAPDQRPIAEIYRELKALSV